MKIPVYSTRFKKEFKLMGKRGYDLGKLMDVITQLIHENPLPPHNRDHALKGNYEGFRECHVGGAGDWLLVYKKDNNILVLVLTETGTHADLFE